MYYLKELATTWRVLPFTQPGAKALTVASDAMQCAAVLLVEIENAAQASVLATSTRYLDTGQSRLKTGPPGGEADNQLQPADRDVPTP